MRKRKGVIEVFCGKVEKMKKILLWLMILVLVWFFIRFVIGGSEDTWICVGGEWVKHGAPAAPMPETPCGK